MMMTDTFDVCEIFEIAEQIEHNGAKFYRSAAKFFNNDVICDTLLKLADWETEHERIFAGMRGHISDLEKTSESPSRERVVADPKAMAGLAVFGLRPDPCGELTGAESRDDILKRALKNEKESIAFYEGLKTFAADDVSKDNIDDIITEEMRHIVILGELL